MKLYYRVTRHFSNRIETICVCNDRDTAHNVRAVLDNTSRYYHGVFTDTLNLNKHVK